MLDRALANWPLKLLAVGLAFAIWVSVTGESRILQDLQVPLEIRLPDELILRSPAPTAVSVRLRGVESQMRRLDPVPIVMRVDLAETPPGDHEVSLAKENLFGIPRGIEVDFVSPNRVQVEVDVRIQRLIAVEPTLLGQPEDGYALYGATVLPESLPVEGPQSQMADLEVLRSNPIRLDGRTASFTARVGVIPGESQVRVLDPRPLQVDVVVDRTAIERVLSQVPVEIVGIEGPISVSPRTLDVTLTGPPDLLDSLTADRLRLVGTAAGQAPGESREVDVHIEFVDVTREEQMVLGVKSISRQRVLVSSAVEGNPS